MSYRCEGCGQFAGEGHECPPWADGPSEKVCANDGCDTVHRNEAYCSQGCQWEGRRGRKKEPDERPCENPACDRQHTNQKYCCPECQWEGRNANAVEVDTSADERSYVVTDDQVIFSVDNKMFRVGIDRWDAICSDYSEYGGDMTQAETARKHGIPLPLMRRVLRAYGQYKASPPMMRERIAEAESLEPLVTEAVENAEYELLNRIERRRRRKMEREWRELREQQQDESRFVEAGKRVAERMTVPPSPAVIVPDASMWPAALAITTDEHLGLPVWGDGSWGENYDTDIAARRLVGQGRSAAEWIAGQGGARVIYRAYAGDLFNAIFGSTTHDTPMDQDTRDEKVWDLAIQAVLGNAQPLRQVCDLLVIIFVSGNHDGPKVYQFASTMRFALEGHDDVEVRATPKKYDAVRVGDALHVFDHGANLTKLSGYKAIADAETVARKAGGEDYHGAEYIGYHVGHKHDRMVVTQGDHMELIRHPALCESSEYEHENRWVATPCADVMLLDERGRIDTPKRLYRDVLDEAGAA